MRDPKLYPDGYLERQRFEDEREPDEDEVEEDDADRQIDRDSDA